MSSLINIDNKWNEYNNLVKTHGPDSEQVKTYLATNTELANEIKNPVNKNASDLLEKDSYHTQETLVKAANDHYDKLEGIPTAEKEGVNDVTPLLDADVVDNPIVNAATTDASDQVGQNQKTNPGFLSSIGGAMTKFADKTHSLFSKDPKESIVKIGDESLKLPGIGKPEDVAGGGLSAGQAAAGLQVGLSAMSTISQNKSLDEAIDSIGDSIDVLDSTKREIAGSYAQDRIDIKSDLSETNQNAALEMMSKIKSNNTEPVTNLNIPSRAAEDIKSNINEKLNTFFSAQKSKSDDVLEAMKTGAETSVARITGDINSLKEEAKKMEDAKRNNWINTGIDVASAGVSLAGGPAGMIGSSALQSLKKTNEYS